MKRLIELRWFHVGFLREETLKPNTGERRGLYARTGHSHDLLSRRWNAPARYRRSWRNTDAYLRRTLRSVASSRTKSSGMPFRMSGRESLASTRSDVRTRLPNNTTARARSSCREDQRKP